MGSEVAVLRDGVLAQIAAPETLYRQPVDAAMARFVGEAVILPGAVTAGFATCALGRLPLARPAPGRARRRDGAARADPLRLDAERGRAARAGRRGHLFRPDASVRLALTGGEEAIASRVPGHRAPRPGDEVRLSVEGTVMAYPRAVSDGAREAPRLAPPRHFPQTR